MSFVSSDDSEEDLFDLSAHYLAPESKTDEDDVSLHTKTVLPIMDLLNRLRRLYIEIASGISEHIDKT